MSRYPRTKSIRSRSRICSHLVVSSHYTVGILEKGSSSVLPELVDVDQYKEIHRLYQAVYHPGHSIRGFDCQQLLRYKLCWMTAQHAKCNLRAGLRGTNAAEQPHSNSKLNDTMKATRSATFTISR